MPALNSGHTIGDISYPDLIGFHHGERPLHAIGDNHGGSASDTAWGFVAANGFNSVQLHNTTHPVFAAGLPDFAQIAMDPTITIYTATKRIRISDERQQALVVFFTRRNGVMQPRIEPGSDNA
ncbi:Uncharacterised protein [Edwardsiella tarda]|nr:Uncharacterised protein [Edwardsiella tarda]